MPFFPGDVDELQGVRTPLNAGFIDALTGAHDPTVPEMINSTTELVTTTLGTNQDFAATAFADARAAMAELSTAVFPPALPNPPAIPSIVTSVAGASAIGFDAPPDLGSISDGTAFNTFDPDAVVIPDITDEIPVYVPAVLGLSIPDAPQLNLPSPITPPAIDSIITLPDAPILNIGAEPALLEFHLPDYTPIVLPVFGDAAPEFDVIPPSPIVNWTEPVYTSGIQDSVRLVLLSMLAGGTGLPADVEAAIWERGRSREDGTAAKTIEEAIEMFTLRGFSAPIGYLNGQAQAVRDDRDLKINGLSRDVMIKQADLEQTNRNFAVEKSLNYEQIFTVLFNGIVDRNFQIAKFNVDTQVQIYNMRVTAFNAEQAVFASKIALYRAQLEGVFAYLKAFEALVSVEKAKADINLAKVAAYEAKIKTFTAQVEAYKALILGQQAKADLQKAIIDGYKAQVDGNVALIQGEKAKFDAYTAKVGGETAKATLEEANARAYAARVQAIGTKADIIIKTADANIAANRLALDWDVANMNRESALHSVELQRIQARLAAFQAGISKGVAVFQANKEVTGFNLQSQIELSRLSIAKYGALLEQWKTRSIEIIEMARINAESLRAAGQIASNLASGALAGTHASIGLSAGVSAGDSKTQSVNNNTSQSKSEGTSNSYSVSHTFPHKAV